MLIKAGASPVQEGQIRSGPVSAAAAAGKLQVCFCFFVFLSSLLVRANGGLLEGTAVAIVRVIPQACRVCRLVHQLPQPHYVM